VGCATDPSATTQCVSRPLSKSALERLGRRLVAGDQPQQGDIERLHMLLAAYRPVLASSVDRVSASVGLVPSSRVKTTATILEKLRRNGGHTLSSIHDLAGMRLVVSGGRVEQDRTAEQIREAFLDGARPPRMIDRRAQPVQGYRAVHVIVYPNGYPIEVQVRTEWQHLWAEWFERLADQYGRGIRYGDPPSSGGESAQEFVDQLINLADQIAVAEETGAAPPLSAVVMALVQAGLDWLRARRPEQ
jgi:ppGpp synthetase/RelA/SpoT-type nucleotidyltranferase